MRKGVRGKGARGIVGQGGSWLQDDSARMASDYQKTCYHESTVLVKINL